MDSKQSKWTTNGQQMQHMKVNKYNSKWLANAAHESLQIQQQMDSK